MPVGIIVKSYCGYYDVLCRGQRYVCKPRGVLAQHKQELYVGDTVTFSVLEEASGVVEAVASRRNLLLQPAAANVDQAVVVVSLQNPVVTAETIDVFLCLVLRAGLQPILCINKIDLCPEDEWRAVVRLYTPFVPTVGVSALAGEQVAELTALLQGRVTVFAGPSGVGKSSLLNKINPEFHRQEGDISQKNKHGKHTTREVELLFLNETTGVLDSPGFTALEEHFAKDEVPQFFPDIQAHAAHCRFQGCQHLHEPDCAVRAAVDDGRIAKSRYASYSTLMTAALAYERNQYKRQYKATYRKGTNKKWLR